MSGYFGGPPMGTVTDEDRARAVEAFKGAALVVNMRQAEALAALLWEGELRGTTYPNVEPPRVAALVAISERESLGQPDLAEDRRTGEHLPDPDDPDMVRMDPEMPASHTIAVVAEDGRMWSIVRAGITWPVPLPEPES
jgi:hypothetical protein